MRSRRLHDRAAEAIPYNALHGHRFVTFGTACSIPHGHLHAKTHRHHHPTAHRHARISTYGHTHIPTTPHGGAHAHAHAAHTRHHAII